MNCRRQPVVLLCSVAVLAAGLLAAGTVNAQQITGQWDFNGRNLQATVGRDLAYFRGCATGPCEQDLEAATRFGTTASFTINPINGEDAKVMRFPAVINCRGYQMPHGIAANGGGNKVNQYTLIMDVYFADADYHAAGDWIALYQAHARNGDDSLLWIRTSDGAVGDDGEYDPTGGTVFWDTWYRIAVVIDTTQSGAENTMGMRKYVDGVFLAEQGADGVDGKRSLWPRGSAEGDILLLFTDNDDETKPGYVNSVQIRDYAMTDAEITALGAATAAGIPSGPGVTGQWDFDEGDLRATVGTNGEYWTRPATPPRDVAVETQFGTTAELGIPDIAGESAVVMKFPQCDPDMGYAMLPEIDSNGGGVDANQYTLIMDILYPAASNGTWRCLLQTADCNTNDGDFFINASNGIGISGTYAGVINADTWYRVAVSVDLAASGGPTMAKYIDGVQVGVQMLNAGVDGRWSLWEKPTGRYTLLFTDEDRETAAGYVNSIQIRDYAMTSEEITALGGPTAAGIPGPGPTCGTPPQDADKDGDVDLTDFLTFQSCFNGPNQPYASTEPGCACLDTEKDSDVDLADFLTFQSCFNGPNRAAACGL